ncbi:hypothetical protein [Enterococcus sp. DIV0187]|uniref:hypothetical protein n=1 Tax=Enterococcus sp. DIV0187 TaxID=2774644 RepID=UPI003F21AC57
MELSKVAISHARAMLRKYNQTKHEVSLYEEMALYPHKEHDSNFGGSRSVAVHPSAPQFSYIAKMDIPAVVRLRELIAKIDEFRAQLLDENEQSVLELRYLTADVNRNGQRQVRSWNDIADAMYVSEKTARRYDERLVRDFAEYLGWVV